MNAGPRRRFAAGGFIISNSAYGATPNTLERKIEADTGVKPEEGMGQLILDALRFRQPVAVNFLEMVELAPRDPGFLVAQSGRVRHFVLPHQEYGVSSRVYDSLASAQGREGRNFFMQESVAATAMRAAVRLLKFAHTWKLQGRLTFVLYDSCGTFCPLEEKHIWSKAHELFMYLDNTWDYHGRCMAYPIDTEINPAWSSRPNKAQALVLEALPTPEARAKFQEAEAWMDHEIEKARLFLSQKPCAA